MQGIDVMAGALSRTLHELTEIQRKAVEWDGGPLLVLAGPGSGKTRVLVCRIARLLDESPSERFRILALTFTNKAAHEMKTRIDGLVPGAVERVEVNTFHGFCARVLRQHGVHCGVKPNFEIYSRTADRRAVLADALRRKADHFGGAGGEEFLPYIDVLKSRLVKPEEAVSHLRDDTNLAPGAAERIGLAYRLYEDELGRANALDFNSLICIAFELLGHPALARHFQTVYRYWHVDEFQDTNGPQYELLRRMAGSDFHQLFAVADDDQTIYEWNGANVQRIRTLVDDFGCEVIQLTDNFRCPPGVVEAGNRLVVYNARRDPSRAAAEPATWRTEGEIKCSVFRSDEDEALRIATEIASLNSNERGEAVVLARSRTLLGPVLVALRELSVPAVLLGRRDDFGSPQMRWLVACLKQINRPLNRRNMATLTEMFGRFTDVHIPVEKVIARSEAEQVTPLVAWLDAVRREAPSASPAVEALAGLATGRARLAEAVAEAVECFGSGDSDEDLEDDLRAWHRMEVEIRQGRSVMPLDQFLQEMELRSKEPPKTPGAVSLSTVHGAKGREFDRVYLIGLAEEVFPSWYSVSRNKGSAAIEEERRICFVAITRTRRRLILSRAHKYKGWPKKPSRFLKEMGMLNQAALTPNRGKKR